METLIVVGVALVILVGAVLIFKKLKSNGSVDEVKDEVDALLKKLKDKK